MAAPPRAASLRRGSNACASTSTTGPACTTRICGCSAASAWCPDARFQSLADIAALGPDPLDDGIDVDRLKDRLARTRLPIKVAILDQTLLPGDRQHPGERGAVPRRHRSAAAGALAVTRRAGRLARGLLESIRYTLKTFKQQRRRRRRRRHRLRRGAEDSEPVPRVRPGRRAVPAACAAAKRGGDGGVIVRIVQAQRATFFCPRCQR